MYCRCHHFFERHLDLFNVTCKQHHRTALNPILNGMKNCDIAGTCKRNLSDVHLEGKAACRSAGMSGSGTTSCTSSAAIRRTVRTLRTSAKRTTSQDLPKYKPKLKHSHSKFCTDVLIFSVKICYLQK